MIYKVSDYYSPEHDRGIAWNDPDLCIDWELFGQQPVLSAKDRAQPALGNLFPLELARVVTRAFRPDTANGPLRHFCW